MAITQSGAATAAALPFTPNGTIAATNVQAAIQEVRDESAVAAAGVLIDPLQSPYNAPTDGTSDATTAIAAAVTAAVAGDTIILSRYVFSVSALTWKSGVNLLLSSSLKKRSGTSTPVITIPYGSVDCTFYGGGAIDCNSIAGAYGLDVGSDTSTTSRITVDNIHFKNTAINGATTNIPGIKLTRCSQCAVVNCHWTSCAMGILCYDIEYTTFENNHFATISADDTINVWRTATSKALTGKGVKIVNNTMVTCKRNAIEIQIDTEATLDYTDCLIAGNTITMDTNTGNGYAISLPNCSDVIVSNNHLY